MQGSVSVDTAEEELAAEEDSVDSKFQCTDGEDDGKIGFLQGVKYFFSGMANKVVNQVKEVVKNPFGLVKSAGIAAAGIAAVGAAVAAAASVPFMTGVAVTASAAGLILGGIQAFKGIVGFCNSFNKAEDAKTDAEKKEAIYNMGGSTTEVVEGVATAAVCAGSLKSLHGSLSKAKEANEFGKKLCNMKYSDDFSLVQEVEEAFGFAPSLGADDAAVRDAVTLFRIGDSYLHNAPIQTAPAIFGEATGMALTTVAADKTYEAIREFED